MIWFRVDSFNENIEKYLNMFFIGNFLLILVSVLPPVLCVLLLSEIFILEEDTCINFIFVTITIWSHILWKLDVRIYVYAFFPVWQVLYMLLILYIISIILNSYNL